MVVAVASAKRFGKMAVVALWRARWWIIAVAILCAVDLLIRLKAFHGRESLAVAVRVAKLFLFYCVAFTAPVFLLGRCSHIVAPILFGFWFVFEAVQMWVLHNFNMVLGGNWVLMVFSTSPAEVGEFATGFMTFGNILFLFSVVAAVAGIAWFFAGRRRKYPSRSLASVVLAVFCLALSCCLAPLAFRAPVSWAQINRDLLALSFPVDTASNWESYRALAAACRARPQSGLSVSHADGKGTLCVFVIGESTTRNHMGIYGYWRDTTPELARICAEGGMTVFADLTTTHSSTPEALCSLLTGEDLISARSFPVVFPAMLKEAGYSTALVSCQGSWQNRDVVGSHLFLSCGSRQFLQGEHAAGTLPDGIALPVVEKALQGMSGDFALFVHLYGCHEPAQRRVPRDFTRNWPDPDHAPSAKARRKLDSYDTAVAYDDQIVASIIRMAAGCGVPACVFFVSDHGESPSSAIWRDARSRDTFEVPMLVWLSTEYRAAYPDTAARVSAASGRSLRMDQLLDGMLELARVEGYRPWDSSVNFLSARFGETKAPKGKEASR